MNRAESCLATGTALLGDVQNGKLLEEEIWDRGPLAKERIIVRPGHLLWGRNSKGFILQIAFSSSVRLERARVTD